MKLLALSHACVTPINQQFFAEVERQTGWDLTLVIPSNWKNEYGQDLKSERWNEYRGNIISIPVWKSGNIPLHTYQSIFLSLLQQIQPDFIYVQHEPYAFATFQIYLANALSIRQPIGFFTWQNIEKCYPIPFHQMEYWILRHTNVMFSGSQSAEQVFRKKGYEGASVLLPGSVDPTIYFPYPDVSSLRSQWTTSDEVILGYLGRIVPEKGLKTLLIALKQIPELPWKLVLVGSGSYELELKKLAEELGFVHRIIFLGYVPHPEAPRYLSAFDVLMIPSETQPNWKEQFGRVIIEAIACGTPVVGSDSGEIPYLIKATGGGLVFPERQPDQLANRLRRLICDSTLRHNLGLHGQKIVLEKYITSSIAERFIQTIDSCLRAF